MKIAITGATGFVGSRLAALYLDQGHQVIGISRSPEKTSGHSGASGGIHTVTWQSLKQRPEQLEGVHAIVNLAGESINQRWTPVAKKRIVQSRLDAAAAIAELVKQLRDKPQVVINASGISIYGPSETAIFDEQSPPRIVDFLSGVVEQWEHAADQIEGVRLVKVRVGVVLGASGGAVPLMALPYKLFVGGKVGSGRQWMPWIHIDDMVGILDACIRNANIAGPVNAVAPHSVTNADFGRTIARVLRRPNVIPVPAFMFKLLFGELSTLLLDGQRVVPKAALDSGYLFKHPDIESALRDILRKPASKQQEETASPS